MPYYDHDKDYPFAAFITNLGKYNEGELVGEWVKFPTTAEELKEVFKRIGIGQKDDFGHPYEEWFITDYDCYVDGLYSKLGEYENLDELNYLASKLDEMSESEYAQFQAGMEMGDHCGSLQEIINLTENLDCYEVYPDIHDYDDLGRYYIEELDVMEQRGNQIIRADVFIQKTTYSDFSCFMPIYRKIIPGQDHNFYIRFCFQQVGGSLKAIGIAEISEVNIHQHNVNVIFRNDAF